jgi:hypothetical protein
MRDGAVCADIVVFAGGHDFCLSLSFVDGVQSGCAGRSEYNDNLPTSASGYTSALDAFDNDVAAYASGELVIAGLSGGGSSALWSMLKTRSDGVTPLYSRAVLFAPYIDVAVIGAYLDFAIHWLGLCAHTSTLQRHAPRIRRPARTSSAPPHARTHTRRPF